MPTPDEVLEAQLEQARNLQRDRETDETRKLEEFLRYREAANAGGIFVAEWEAQVQHWPSVSALRSAHENSTATLTDAEKAEVERARGVEYLRSLADKVKSALRRAGNR